MQPGHHVFPQDFAGMRRAKIKFANIFQHSTSDGSFSVRTNLPVNCARISTLPRRSCDDRLRRCSYRPPIADHVEENWAREDYSFELIEEAARAVVQRLPVKRNILNKVHASGT